MRRLVTDEGPVWCRVADPRDKGVRTYWRKETPLETAKSLIKFTVEAPSRRGVGGLRGLESLETQS